MKDHMTYFREEDLLCSKGQLCGYYYSPFKMNLNEGKISQGLGPILQVFMPHTQAGQLFLDSDKDSHSFPPSEHFPFFSLPRYINQN